MDIRHILNNCILCPRKCGVDRTSGHTGACHMTDTVRVSRAALHMWEEPCISGENGSGAVFFSGCALGCCFCQNKAISGGKAGKDISISRLCNIFFELQDKGANNINLVTPDHYIPQIISAIDMARSRNFKLPFVYNCSGYETAEMIQLLDGYIDVYLPDFKFMSPDLSAKYSNAPDYPEHAKASISISIMNQYTPMPGIENRFPELGRTITPSEYDELVDYAIDIGVENGFIQEGETAKESFIPAFDNEGV